MKNMNHYKPTQNKKTGGERPTRCKRAFPPLIRFCLYGYRLFPLPCFQVRTLRTFRTFLPLIKVLAGLRQVGLSPTAAYSPEDKVRTLLRTFPPLIKVLVGLRQVSLSPTTAYAPEDKVRTLRTFRTSSPLICFCPHLVLTSYTPETRCVRNSW